MTAPAGTATCEAARRRPRGAEPRPLTLGGSSAKIIAGRAGVLHNQASADDRCSQLPLLTSGLFWARRLSALPARAVFRQASSCATCSIRSASPATPTTCRVPGSAGTTSCSKRRSCSRGGSFRYHFDADGDSRDPQPYRRATAPAALLPGGGRPVAAPRDLPHLAALSARGRPAALPAPRRLVRRASGAGRLLVRCSPTCRSTGCARHGRAPWPRAGGMSVLARAWQCTSDERYVDAAQRALAALLGTGRARRRHGYVRRARLRTRYTRRSRPRTS